MSYSVALKNAVEQTIFIKKMGEGNIKNKINKRIGKILRSCSYVRTQKIYCCVYPQF